ncbi:MAG: formylglycine-generating enzyme family protein [Actinomycetota bacterium]
MEPAVDETPGDRSRDDLVVSHACCTPSAPSGRSSADDPVPGSERLVGGASTDLLDLAGGAFLMGTEDGDGFPGDGEGPIRKITLSSFRISARPVTNDEFGSFVESVGYRTEAERWGWSFVFGGLLPDDFPPTRAAAQTPWWRQVEGATWDHPEGPHSDVSARGEHPVVHVSWSDTLAYCRWAGVRLPTEAEWEYAARGGLEQSRFAWGDELVPGGRHVANIWQGTFPSRNTLDDGYVGTNPVGAFPPNGYGLVDCAGNVWEWCADWFDRDFHVREDAPRVDPTGPPQGQARVIRGGSYLCHDSYCNRYRVAARSSNTPDSSTGNMGFRIAADAA